jgi:hypothetical protein
MQGRLGSTPKGTMNRTEAKYAERLALAKCAGQVVSWHYEEVKLCVVPGLEKKRAAVFYTPDFMVLFLDGHVEMIDVKGAGGWEDTARVKIKAAADRFPEFAWVGMTFSKAGEWEREEFN